MGTSSIGRHVAILSLTLLAVCLATLPADALPDFNGDGKADILWRHDSGTVAIWLLDGFNMIGHAMLGNVSNDWKIEIQADFNGDEKTDILWRHTSGAYAIWLIDGLTVLGSGSLGNPSGWRVTRVADFNGDGKGDLLWEGPGGSAAVWLMDGTHMIDSGLLTGIIGVIGVGDFDGDGKADVLTFGTVDRAPTWPEVAVHVWLIDGVSVTGSAMLGKAHTHWLGPIIADFNGDGKADILWDDELHFSLALWLVNGTSVIQGDWLSGSVGHEWLRRGVVDFNDDGKTDILWLRVDGLVAVWLFDGFVIGSGLLGQVNAAVIGAGDLDGDGKADILFRSSSGAVSAWLIDGTAVVGAGFIGTAPPEWKVQ